ncbi:MAG: hypothetical protein WD689_08130 [Gaiellaceae bacterium]
MDPAHALADLTEISAQIEAAVIASEDGTALASTLDDTGASALSRAAVELLGSAAGVEAVTGEGSLFAARDGGRVAAAVTGSGSASGLVLYDLRTCLRRLDEPA